MADVVPLEPVERVELTTLVDNSFDSLLASTPKCQHHYDPGQTRPAAFQPSPPAVLSGGPKWYLVRR